jgi:hypothetical protein
MAKATSDMSWLHTQGICGNGSKRDIKKSKRDYGQEVDGYSGSHWKESEEKRNVSGRWPRREEREGGDGRVEQLDERF